jgi:hypothetical protein
MREGGAQLRSGERGDGGARFRAERGMRDDGGTRFRAERRGDRGVEFGFRDRDRGFRDRDRRHFGRRGVFIEGGYGYVPGSCEWLRRRALASGSPYWWRRYRACTGY